MTTDAGATSGSYLRADHDRLEALLARALRPEAIDLEVYGAFRRGLLRHIGLEEKILLPAARRWNDGIPIAAAARLRLDHGAIAALLVPTPTPAIIAAIRAILAEHNRIEEAPGGVYDLCERLAGPADGELLATLRAAPEVAVSALVDGELVVAATRRALMRAGYDPETMGL